MTAAYFEDHPTDPDKVILRKPQWLAEERYAEIHTAKRTWVGLTPEEEEEIITKAHSGAGWRFYIREAEAKLKEKNNG